MPQVRPGSFPRLQKRGPIEATTASAFCASMRRFHAYKSVAPLKPGRCGARVKPGAMFPRLQKRGPIEAPTRVFRQLLRLHRFPRLQKRGPIEASALHSPRCTAYGFHAYKSVAPLKLVGHNLQA